MELKYALRLQAVWRGRKARRRLKWRKSIKKVLNANKLLKLFKPNKTEEFNIANNLNNILSPQPQEELINNITKKHEQHE